MNPHSRKSTNYLLISLLLIGVAAWACFFIPELRSLTSERLTVARLREELGRQKQAVEGLQRPDKEEKLSWAGSKGRLKALCRPNADATSLKEELTVHAKKCGIRKIIITPHNGTQTEHHEPMKGLPSGVGENKVFLRISFHADYASLGRFLKWFDYESHHATVLHLSVKRDVPQVTVIMEIQVNQLTCNW